MAGVYVIAHKLDDGWAGPCKIGISRSWHGRLNSLQSGNPMPIGLYAFYNIGDRETARAVEQAVHRTQRDKRLVGEWFQVDPTVAAVAIEFMIAAMFHTAAESIGSDADGFEYISEISSGPGADFGSRHDAEGR